MPFSPGESSATTQGELDLSQAIGSYTVLTATGGDIWIDAVSVVVTTETTLVTSASIVDDETQANVIWTALLAALVDGAVLPQIANSCPRILRSGKSIKLLLVGVQGTGAATAYIRWRSDTGAGVLS